jgi:hypothetical protein
MTDEELRLECLRLAGGNVEQARHGFCFVMGGVEQEQVNLDPTEKPTLHDREMEVADLAERLHEAKNPVSKTVQYSISVSEVL